MGTTTFKPDDLEIQILKCVALGMNNSEIGKILFVSSHTVKARLARIYRRLNCNNRTEATHIATKLGII